MRKLIFAINITLDGCCDHTKVMPYDDLVAYHTELLRNADLFVYGRKTYELMVPYWPDLAKNHSSQPKADIEFAQAFDAVDKTVVFSHSLRQPGGKIRESFKQIFRKK
jgi:dihydrofolate reductase